LRRILIGAGGLALVVAGVAFVLWSNSTAPPKTAPEAIPSQQAALPPSPSPSSPKTAAPPPSFDIVKVDPSGHAVIAGRAAPGAQVKVLDGNKKLGEVTADARGEWVLVPSEAMAPGERQLTLEATDPGNGNKIKSSDTVALAVAPLAPTGKGSSPGTVAVLLPGNANQPAQVLQTPNARSGSLSLDTAEYNDRGELMMSGHATPGATLRLYAQNEPIATVTADGQGKWASVSPRAKASGKVELRVDELNTNGSVAQRVAEPFEPQSAELSGRTPTGSYTVRPGNSLWAIARQAYGGGTRYTIIFSANKDHIHDPNLIYPGQVITLPKS
jgi:LysM repeat protein